MPLIQLVKTPAGKNLVVDGGLHRIAASAAQFPVVRNADVRL